MSGLGFTLDNWIGWVWVIHNLLNGLNGQLVFKDLTHLLPAQTHPLDTPSLH
jgi:hypothetical protein